MKQGLVTVLVIFCFMLTSCSNPQQEDSFDHSQMLDNSQELPIGAQFTGVYSISREDPNEDGKYDFITAEAEVKIIEEGAYSIYGTLFFKGLELTSRPSYWSAAPSHFYLSAKPGVKTITLTFSGQEIYEERKNGKYVVELRMVNEDGQTNRVSFETPDFRYKDFGEVYQ